jgi:hypothetical protein
VHRACAGQKQAVGRDDGETVCRYACKFGEACMMSKRKGSPHTLVTALAHVKEPGKPSSAAGG